VGVVWLVDEGCTSCGWYGELIVEWLSGGEGWKDELRCKGLAGVVVCSRTFPSFVWLCVCVYAAVQVYMYVYMRVCMYAWVCVCMCTCSHKYFLIGPCMDVFICIPTTSREREIARDMKREREFSR
jgi:hypothetical protein